MNTDSFTDEQMLNLVNNTITNKTEFKPHEFTGGSVILTTTHKNTIKKFKVSLYFGYKGKHSINRQIEISKELYFIWAKAIMVKIYSLDATNAGMDINELNKLMQSNSNSNSNLSNSSIGNGGNPVPTPVPTQSEEEALFIADYLHHKILLNKPNFVCKNIQTWINDIEKAIRLDKRTQPELLGCINWIYSDSKGAFWIPNIMSGKKLRDKFDTMESQMINKNKQSDNGLDAMLEAYNAS